MMCQMLPKLSRRIEINFFYHAVAEGDEMAAEPQRQGASHRCMMAAEREGRPYLGRDPDFLLLGETCKGVAP